jgi:hypothetical protein
MYLLFIWGGTYGFGWGEIHNEGSLKGVGPEIETFLGPEMATIAASAIWAQKSRDFRTHPFKRPEKWISPFPNPYVQPYIKKTGTLVILWTRDFRAHSEMVSNQFWTRRGNMDEKGNMR